MSIGHGALGVRSNLRTFSDLMLESALSRRILLEFAPGVAVSYSAWVLDTGATYRAFVQKDFDGIVRDVVGCESSAGPGGSIGRLTRVETLADCRATAGTYFYDVDSFAVQLAAWDMAGSQWDAGLSWDQYPAGVLYVHLHDDTDPRVSTVLVTPLYGFYFSGEGVVHPNLGTNKISSDLSTWTETRAGIWDDPAATWDGGGTWDPSSDWSTSVSATQITLQSVGTSTGYAQRAITVPTMIAGARYRISGAYTSPADNAAGLSIGLVLKADTYILYPDGRSADANGGITLTPTYGEHRRFFADILVPTYPGAGVFTLALKLSGSGVGSVTFDSIKVQRIWRFNFYEPRLAESSIPEMEIAATSMFFDSKAVSLGSASLINGDGLLESAFGSLLLMRKPAQVFVGGAFADGQEVYKEDFRTAFLGYSTDVDVDDDKITIALEDFRAFLKTTFPPRSYSRSDFSDIDPAQEGKPRRLLWGIKSPCELARINATANNYGVYEAVDTTPAPNGIMSIVNGAVTSQATQEFAPSPGLTNSELGDGGWTGYPGGAGSWANPTDDTTGAEAGDGTPGTSSVGAAFTDQTASIPTGAIIDYVIVRMRLGQKAVSEFGVGSTGSNTVPVRPFLRYAGGSAMYGTYVQITTSVFAWYDQIFPKAPDGSAWTRTNIFKSGASALRIGTQSDPTGVSSGAGYFTDCPGAHIIVVYRVPGSSNATPQVACFTNKEAADKPPLLTAGADLSQDAHYNLAMNTFGEVDTMPSPDQVTIDLTTARVTDVKPSKLIAVSDDAGILVNWTTERGTRSVNLPATNVRTLYGWAQAMTNVFAGAGDPDVTVTFDTSLQKFKVTKTTGTLTILCKTGSEPHRQPWAKMGFVTTADLSGALSYTATTAAYVRDTTRDDIDVCPVRAVVHGYKDDASGTYTGSANTAIEKAPDVAMMICRRLFGLPASRIDSASFVAARATTAGGRRITVDISTQQEARVVLGRLEATALADIIFDGDGTVYFRSYTAGAPSTIRDFYDRDYLGNSFKVRRRQQNVYKGVRIYYGNDHLAGNGWASVERLDLTAAVKYGRDEVKEVYVYVRTSDEATVLRDQYFRLATADPRVVEFDATSKLVDLQVGDKIRINRARGLDPTGAITGLVCRIRRLRHNYISGVSHVEALEDVSFLS